MKKVKKVFSYIIYWILQCTWGAVMTLIGCAVTLGLLITGHKPKKLGPNIYFEVGGRWGGVNLGPFFVCSEGATNHTKYHESGHGLQNIIWGPLMPLVVGIPSVARWWLFRFKNPMQRAVYTAGILFTSLVIFTLMAWLMTFTGVKWLVISFEVLRLYFATLTLWLNTFQIPHFYNGYPGYESVWFESQATKWGTQVYEKKEG